MPASKPMFHTELTVAVSRCRARLNAATKVRFCVPPYPMPRIAAPATTTVAPAVPSSVSPPATAHIPAMLTSDEPGSSTRSPALSAAGPMRQRVNAANAPHTSSETVASAPSGRMIGRYVMKPPLVSVTTIRTNAGPSAARRADRRAAAALSAPVPVPVLTVSLVPPLPAAAAAAESACAAAAFARARTAGSPSSGTAPSSATTQKWPALTSATPPGTTTRFGTAIAKP